jgi:long-chain acyl-CoA synthetase
MKVIETSNHQLVHTYRGVGFYNELTTKNFVDHAVNRWAKLQPLSPFLTTVSATNQENQLSYGELDGLSHRFIGWLNREFQLQAGDIIGLLPRNDLESVLTIISVLRSEFKLMMLDASSPLARLIEQVDSVKCKLVLKSPRLTSEVFPDARNVPSLSAVRNLKESKCAIENDPYTDAIYFATSGSTAASKIVSQCLFNAHVNAQALKLHHHLRPESRFLGCLPIHHVNGFHFSVLAQLYAGAHSIIAETFNPFQFPGLIKKFRPHIASVVPSILEVLSEIWRQQTVPDDFEYFVSAAAPLSQRTASNVRVRVGAQVLQGYGLTETTNFSTTMPRDLSRTNQLLSHNEIPSVGVALFGNEIQILRPDGSHASPGEVGEICMRGHNVMTGYYGNTKDTSIAFRDGWFHSGDLGLALFNSELGKDFYFITGRVKNIAKVRGEAVSLDEMDRFLKKLPYISDAACIAIPTPLIGEEIVAAIVLNRSVTDSEIRMDLAEKFSAVALPKMFIRRETIPRTPTGKILRPELVTILKNEMTNYRSNES